MKVLSIDFETRSRIDLKDRGLDVYSSDPSTEILCLAAGYDAKNVGVWHANEVPSWVFDHIKAGGMISAWNAMFEHYIWNRVGGKLGWPELKLEQCVDAMAIAAANNIPQDLDGAGELIDAEFQKDKRGKKLIQLLCKPQRDGEFLDNPELMRELLEYCQRDVQTELSIVSKLRPLSPAEQDVWVLTQKINLRGVPVEPKELDNVQAVVEQEMDMINQEIVSLTGGIEVSKRDQLKSWFYDRGLDLPDMQADTIEKAALKGHEDPIVSRVLQLRMEGAKTSVTKFSKMAEVHVGGRIRNGLVFHGASTGRWASRGINLQNIARPAVWMQDQDIHDAVEMALVRGDHKAMRDQFGEKTMDACSSIVRNALRAPDGYAFVDADLSSIENRVSAWMAGQNDKLELFRTGLDEYKTFASTSLYHVPYDEVTKDMRQVSKSAVLGCMFGQGAKGLVGYAEKMGVVLSAEQAEKAVNAYRESYSRVKACWYAMGEAAVAATLEPNKAFKAGRVLLKVARGALWMQLPSGRLIAWQKPEVREELTPWGKMAKTVYVLSQNTYTRKWGMNKLIGSSIFQSSVQGTARDFIAGPALALDAEGIPVIMLVHDEILALSEIETAKHTEERLMTLLTTAPAWAKDFPLAAESWIDTRYRK